MELSVIPVFQSEIMPAPVRGFAVGSYQMSIGLGGLIINSVCRGTSTLTTNAAWRIPMGLYYIVPTIVGSSVWFIPESPRFLLSKARVEEAKVSLRRLRVDKSASAIDTEVESILLSLEAEKDNGTYSDLVKGTNLRRTLIVMGTNFFLQATGQSFSSSYGTVFIKSLGTVNAFTMAAVNTSLNAVGSFIGMVLVDKVGRRPILCVGSFMQGAVLLTMGGVGSIATQTVQTKSAVVAMTTLFGFTFSTGWAPLTYIISSEMGEQKLRDKTQRVGSWVNVLTK
jgi:MFS family permease